MASRAILEKSLHTPEAAKKIAQELFSRQAKRLVLSNRKSTPAAAAKALSRTVFRAASNSARRADDVSKTPKPCSGNVLVTKQTGPEGRLVSKAAGRRRARDQKGTLSRRPARSRHFAARHHGQHRRRHGHRGSRREDPEKISRNGIDPAVGIMPYQARKLAAALGLKGDLIGVRGQIVAGRL